MYLYDETYSTIQKFRVGKIFGLFCFTMFLKVYYAHQACIRWSEMQ